MDQKNKRSRDEEDEEELSEEEEEIIEDEDENEEENENLDEDELDEETAEATENAEDITESEISEDELSSDEESDEEATTAAPKAKIATKIEATRPIIRKLKNYVTVLPPAKNETAETTKIISVVNEYQTTRNIISYTEKAKLIATRAGQIEAGSAPFVSIEGKLTATEIAELEWRMQKFPLSIMREIAAKNEMRNGEMTTVIYVEIINPLTCIIP